MNCRSCNTPIKQFFSLGDMPLVNSFPEKSEIAREKKYDLSVGFCPKCYLCQLTKTISPDILFRDYIYFSSTSQALLKYCKETAGYLVKRLGLTKKDLVLEIASNDGVLLQFFQKLGLPILGVDPAINIAKVANEHGIPTIPEFFTHAFAKKLVQEKHTSAQLIYGANVLAHVPGITNFLKGVRTVLADKGSAVFEFPYIQGLLDNKFDTIYHEHVFYYSLLALESVFERAGLLLYDVELVPMQGGSLRIYACHPGAFEKTKQLQQLREKELKKGYNKLSTYRLMGKKVEAHKQKLRTLLAGLKKKGKTVALYSAPAKGMILANYFGIGENAAEYIVDKSPAKQWLYTPGTHMLVCPPQRLLDQPPDYIMILCWNIAAEVMAMKEMETFKKRGGKFIIPIPTVSIVSA